MYYLLDKNSLLLAKNSEKLLKEKGAQFEFDIESRVLTQFKLVINSLIVSGKCDYDIAVKEIADALIVVQHHINVADIKWQEIDDYAKFRQIERTYRAVFQIENYAIKKPLQTELDLLSVKVYETNGTNYQLRILAEETGELDKEVMKFNRKYLSGSGTIKYLISPDVYADQITKLKEDRACMIGETFDFLFTLRYFFKKLQNMHNKTPEELFQDLNTKVCIRVSEINQKVFGG